MSDTGHDTTLVLEGKREGITLIPERTPLTRLHYFDGKFLKADDLTAEQRYHRALVALSNHGLGSGVVYGFDVKLAGGDRLRIGPGLGVSPSGALVHLPDMATVSIGELVAASAKAVATAEVDAVDGAVRAAKEFGPCAEAKAPPTGGLLSPTDAWVIVLCPAEAYCGEADVYGKLCEDACVGSRQRPWVLEGVVVRALPLSFRTPGPAPKTVSLADPKYLRAKVAHRYFGDEALAHPGAISRAGLLSSVWCFGARYDASGCEVPIGVFARSGATTLFLDAWTARRERIDAPARRYWQWKMRMRPWDVFLAQVLQFQCQLAGALSDGDVTPGGDDPCRPAHAALGEVAGYLDSLERIFSGSKDAILLNRSFAEMGFSSAAFSGVKSKVYEALAGAKVPKSPRSRILIERGLFELPSAGYLPVVLGTKVTVNDQVKALLGEGVDLRFCVVRPDFVAHALEEAQHMERISLVDGLDDAAKKPKVDILVPDGEPLTLKTAGLGTYWEVRRPAAETLTLSQNAFEGAGVLDLLRDAAPKSTPAPVEAHERPAAKGKTKKAAPAGPPPARGPQPPPPARDVPLSGDTIPESLDRKIWVNANALDDASDPLLMGAARTAALATGGGAFYFAGLVSPKLRQGTGASQAIWLQAQVARDPFEMDAGESCFAALRQIELRPGRDANAAEPAVNDRRLTGELRIQTPAQTKGTTTRVLALFDGVFVAKGPGGDESHPVQLPAAIWRRDEGNDSTVIVEVKTAARLKLPSEVVYRWREGDPTKGLLSVREDDGGSTPVKRDLAVNVSVGADGDAKPVASFTESVAVAEETNAAHEKALESIRTIATALKEPLFRETAERNLFPPLPAKTDELVIRPTLDWVLFHRRRDKNCGAAQPQPRPEPPNRYRVFELTAQDAGDAKQWFELAQSPDAANQAKVREKLKGIPSVPEPELYVEFGGGTSTLKTDPSAIAADWPGFRPGNTLAYALVARPASTETLEENRLRVLSAAVPQAVTDTSSPAREEALSEVPSGWVDPKADGSMLLITFQRSQVVRREALAVVAPRRQNGDHDVSAGFPSTTFTFENEKPSSSKFADFVATPPVPKPVRGVTLATVVAPDAKAEKRRDVVVEILMSKGKWGPPERRNLGQVTAADKAALTTMGLLKPEIDDVIFLEPND